MSPKLKKALKVAAWTVGIALSLIIVSGILLNSAWAQQRIKDQATKYLSERLQTRVAVEGVSVNILTHDASLRGVVVEDRQHRKMLEADRVEADVNWWALRRGKVDIDRVKLNGVTLRLHKAEGDSVANFAFVIDALKGDSTKTKSKTDLQIKSFSAERIAVIYNNDSVTLRKLTMKNVGEGIPTGNIEDLALHTTHTGRKGITTHHYLTLNLLKLSKVNKKPNLEIELTYRSDNHRPRKNTGKPHRGFFDAGHFDATAKMQIEINHIAPDTVNATLKRFTMTDTTMGFDVRELHCDIAGNRRYFDVTNMDLRQIDTKLHIPSARVTLPDKAAGTPVTYSTGTVTGTAILRDIARPFAPILHRFTMPLQLSVVMTGDDNTIRFSDVVVKTPDNRFSVSTHGWVDSVQARDNHNLRVHYDVTRMTVKTGMAKKIFDQFPIKKFMMKQLNALGDINFGGALDVRWKHETITGRLQTRVGAMGLRLEIDQLSHYISGSATTTNLDLGRAIDMPDIGVIAATARFQVDISKERTGAIRRKKGGKLPIGKVSAHVDKCSYKFVKVGDLDATIESDGAVAQGELTAHAKYMDTGCTFTFTDTDNMRKMKIKPKLSFHGAKKKNGKK